MDDQAAAVEALTPGARLRRLLMLCHVADRTNDVAGEWRRLGPDDLVDALRADPEAGADPRLDAVVEALTRDRDEIPAGLRSALARLFRVSEVYFEDPAVAEREETRLLPRLLDELGVSGAHLCRCPPAADLRVALWAGLLEVARKHARTDLADGLP